MSYLRGSARLPNGRLQGSRKNMASISSHVVHQGTVNFHFACRCLDLLSIFLGRIVGANAGGGGLAAGINLITVNLILLHVRRQLSVVNRNDYTNLSLKRA